MRGDHPGGLGRIGGDPEGLRGQKQTGADGQEAAAEPGRHRGDSGGQRPAGRAHGAELSPTRVPGPGWYRQLRAPLRSGVVSQGVLGSSFARS